MNLTKSTIQQFFVPFRRTPRWQDIATIEERLDLVTFFLTMEGVFTSTLKILGDFMDLDRMLSDLVTVPKQVDNNNRQQRLRGGLPQCTGLVIVAFLLQGFFL